MTKPQKRKFERESIYLQYDKGYNHACNDWEGWLPSGTEIVDILVKPHEVWRGVTMGLKLEKTDPIVLAIAKAISKRLRGK